MLPSDGTTGFDEVASFEEVNCFDDVDAFDERDGVELTFFLELVALDETASDTTEAISSDDAETISVEVTSVCAAAEDIGGAAEEMFSFKVALVSPQAANSIAAGKQRDIPAKIAFFIVTSSRFVFG